MRQVTDKATGEVVEYTEQQFIALRNQLIEKWEQQKAALDFAKEEEMRLRKELTEFCFNETADKGTFYEELGGGWRLKAGKSTNYGWIKKEDGKTVDRDAIEIALQAIEEDGEAGKLIAERLVKFKPELSLTEYNQLPEEFKDIIDEVIVTSPGSPTLELVPPKGAKK